MLLTEEAQNIGVRQNCLGVMGVLKIATLVTRVTLEVVKSVITGTVRINLEGAKNG
jgi:hypothetical protein